MTIRNVMNGQKPLQFTGTAGGYFVVWLLWMVVGWIPFLGWAFAFNFSSTWLVDNLIVNGKRVTYKAGYGETLWFIFVSALLLIVTFGIYSFWFLPKTYRYIVDHIQALEGVTAPVAAAIPPFSKPT